MTDGRNGSIDKFLSQSSTGNSENLGLHLATLTQLIEIIDNSVDVERHPDYKKIDGKRDSDNGVDSNSVLVHRMYGAISFEGRVYLVKTTMLENRGRENDVHDYRVTKVELHVSGSATSNAQGSPTLISGANLLKGVEKSYDSGKKLLDAEYLDAVEAGNMGTAKRLVREAAAAAMPNTKVLDKDGKPRVVEHATNSDFTEFDISYLGKNCCDYVKDTNSVSFSQ